MKKQLCAALITAALAASALSVCAQAEELTDGKFAETKHITVEVYDRGIDGGSDVTVTGPSPVQGADISRSSKAKDAELRTPKCGLDSYTGYHDLLV